MPQTFQSPPHAHEMAEMLQRPPSWLLRWGLLSIAGALALLLAIAAFVRYPDTLEGSAVITTNPLPIRLKAGNSGRVVALFLPDGAAVSAGQPLAELQNNTGYSSIKAISALADSAAQYLQREADAPMQALLQTPLLSLGEVQEPYNRLLQSISAYLSLRQAHIYSRRAGNLQQQIGRYNAVAAVTTAETALTKEELAQSAERFKANEKLYRDKVISQQEYFEEAAKLRQRQMTLESQRRAALQNAIAGGDNSKQLLEIEWDRGEQERTLRLTVEESIRNLQNAVQTWKLQYLLLAPFAGTLHYLRPLQVGEPTTAGDELFVVTPQKFRYTAQVQLPATGLGKVKVGQATHLLLAQFPYNEYGYLEGTVSAMSALPQKLPSAGGQSGTEEATYRIQISLPDSLVTSYHRQLPFTPEMAAQARIITHDRSLLQRLLSSLSKK